METNGNDPNGEGAQSAPQPVVVASDVDTVTDWKLMLQPLQRRLGVQPGTEDYQADWTYSEEEGVIYVKNPCALNTYVYV